MKSQLKLKFLLYETNILSIFNKKSKNKTIALLTCHKWRNKVSDDLLIKKYLLKSGFNVDIIAWEDSNDLSKYDAIIIRSIWGYEKQIIKFEEFLNKIPSSTKLINSRNIVNANYHKDIQLHLLDKYNIPHIPTSIIDINCNNIEKQIKLLGYQNDFVIKPSISASGGHTYLISNNSSRHNVIKYNQINTIYNNINIQTKLLIQPFYPQIDDGELSIVYINNMPVYALKRYPKVLNSTSKVEYLPIEDVDKKAILLGNKISKIKEYKDNLYFRVDMLKINNDYLIMEVELVEPDLFIRLIKNHQRQEEILREYTKTIKKIME